MDAKLSQFTSLEIMLCDNFGFSNAVLGGRMRSCIVALYERLLSQYKGSCILPSNVCPTLITAVVSSGANVELVDTDLMSGGPDDDKLALSINNAKTPGVVNTF